LISDHWTTQSITIQSMPPNQYYVLKIRYL